MAQHVTKKNLRARYVTKADDPLWTPVEAGDYLGVAANTLKDWRARGRGPRYVRLSGSTVRYRKSAVDEWLESREVDH